MTVFEYAIARHKAQLERTQQRRPLNKYERDRLKLLRNIVDYYEYRENTKSKINVQSGT